MTLLFMADDNRNKTVTFQPVQSHAIFFKGRVSINETGQPTSQGRYDIFTEISKKAT